MKYITALEQVKKELLVSQIKNRSHNEWVIKLGLPTLLYKRLRCYVFYGLAIAAVVMLKVSVSTSKPLREWGQV